MTQKAALLEVKGVKTTFKTERRPVTAVDDISFHIDHGETLALVGESGCGKSVTSLSILRLIQEPPGKIEKGEILYKGNNLLSLSKKEMRKIRGNEISMIFQEPMTSLNPLFTVGNQIMEAVKLHQGLKKGEAVQKCIHMLGLVGIPDPEKRMSNYPHEMSGGMRQRVMIAMALACQPGLLIADEPTTALDVTIQAQILELIRELKKKMDMSLLLITHDFGIVAEMADRVGVMYGGRMVEYGGIEEIFNKPAHPYTVGLLNAIPGGEKKGERLRTIPGNVPDLAAIKKGCNFYDRCPIRTETCLEKAPEMEDRGNSHFSRCWHSDRVKREGLF
ncbi:MAG: ABC transporter ATP-binding protein [Deltaproteobacteria bacterium]|nr:ABC transporter ATP-binding protein [Deltaproteobacteria bacterium]